jgi:lysozyme family protein
MADTFDLVFPELLKHEGGYTNNPTDGGNYTGGKVGVGNLVGTNLGVSAGAMSNYLGRPATVEDMQGITPEFARPFFRQRYWNAVNADNLPLGLDYAMADMAYHSGPERAIRTLQNTLGTQTTGQLGTADYNAITAHGNPQALAGQYIANRRTFLEGLSNYPTFGAGWNARLDGIQNTLADWNKNSPLNDWGRLHPAKVQNLNSEEYMKMAANPFGVRTAAPAYGAGDMWGYDTARVGNDTDYLDHFSRQINTGQMPVAWDSAYDPSKFQNLANNPLSDSTFRYRQQDRFGNSLAGLLGNQNWYDPQKGVTYNPNYMDGYDALGRPIDVDNFVNSHPTFAKGGNTGGLVYQTDGTYKPANQGWFGSSNDNAWGYGGEYDPSAYGFNGTNYSTGDPQNATSAIQAAQYMNLSGGYDSSGIWRSQPDITAYNSMLFSRGNDSTYGPTTSQMVGTSTDQFGQPMGGSGATLWSPTAELGGGLDMATAARQNAAFESVFQSGAQDHMFYEGQLNNLTANNGWTDTNVFQPQQINGYTYQPQNAVTTWGVNNPTVDQNISGLNPQNNPYAIWV